MNRKLVLYGCFSITMVLLLARMVSGPYPIIAQEPASTSTSTSPNKDATKSRVIVVLVDPEAPRADIVKELASALEKSGIVRQETKAAVDPSDTSHQLTMTLGLQPTVEYNRVETLLNGLSKLQDDAQLRIFLYVPNDRRNHAFITGGKNLPAERVQQVSDYLNKQTAVPLDTVTAQGAQTVDVAQKADVATAAAPPAVDTSKLFRITMLGVKGDWSQVPAAEQIKNELQKKLADAGIPNDLMETLPQSGSKIYFSNATVATYSAKAFAHLESWLTANDLIATRTPFTDIQQIGYTGDVEENNRPGNGGHVKQRIDAPVFETELDLDPKLLHLSQPVVSNEAFLNRENRLSFELSIIRRESGKMAYVNLHRILGMWETPRGGVPTRQRVWNRDAFAFQVPENNVVIINADASESGHPNGQEHRKTKYILVVEHVPLIFEEKPNPEPMLPDRAAAVTGISSDWRYLHRVLQRMPGQEVAEIAGTSGAISDGTYQTPTTSPSPEPEGPATEVATTSSAPMAKGGSVTRTYRFKHISVEAVVDVVVRLLPELQYSRLPGSGNTNQFIVRDDPQVVAQFEEILKQIDRPLESVSSAQTAFQTQGQFFPPSGIDFTEKPSTPLYVAKLKQDSTSQELRTLELAAEIRQKRVESPQDQALHRRLDRELNTAVAAAFEARQKLLQTQVSELQRRAERIQQSVATRNRVAKEIVARRVADLLNPDLNWDTKESAPSSETGSPSPETGTPTAAKPSPPPKAKPEDLDTPLEHPDTRASVVWIELTAQYKQPDGAVARDVTYLCGTLLTKDGLVGFCTEKGMPEQVALDTIESALVRLYGENDSSRAKSARLVAYDPSTGLALLKLEETRPSNYLSPVVVPPAVGRMLKYYCRPSEKANPNEPDARISDLSSTKGDHSGQFEVTFDQDFNVGPGGPLIDSAARLQGILGQRKPRDKPVQEAELRKAVFEVIPSKDIVALIAKYRGNKTTARKLDSENYELDITLPVSVSGVEVVGNTTIPSDKILELVRSSIPGHALNHKGVLRDVQALQKTGWFAEVRHEIRSTDEGLAIVFHVSERSPQEAAATDPEPVRMRAILFELDATAADKLLTKPVKVEAATTLPVPADFDRKLGDLKAGIKVISRPTIRTLLNQPAKVQIGQSVNTGLNQLQQQVQVGTLLEVLPTRRIDRALQLDLLLQLEEQGKTPAAPTGGDIVLPATNLQTFRASVVVPDKNQVLMAFPAGDSKSNQALYVFIEVVPAEPASRQVFPNPIAGDQAQVVAVRAGSEVVMRNPAEYRKLLDEVATQLAEPQQTIDNLLDELRKTKAEATEADLIQAHPRLIESLQRIRQREQLIRDELAAQIKLLQLEIKDSESALKLADNNFNRLQTLSKRSVISASEVEVGQRERDQAQGRIEKARLLLDLYLKVDPAKPKDVIGLDR